MHCIFHCLINRAQQGSQTFSFKLVWTLCSIQFHPFASEWNVYQNSGLVNSDLQIQLARAIDTLNITGWMDSKNTQTIKLRGLPCCEVTSIFAYWSVGLVYCSSHWLHSQHRWYWPKSIFLSEIVHCHIKCACQIAQTAKNQFINVRLAVCPPKHFFFFWG